MRFVETPVFTRAIRAAIDDESYRALQIALMLRPEQGAVIKGSNGLRKVRWARAGAGKRGGLFYMLYVYAKNEQGDLTAAQLRLLSALVREEFK